MNSRGLASGPVLVRAMFITFVRSFCVYFVKFLFSISRVFRLFFVHFVSSYTSCLLFSFIRLFFVLLRLLFRSFILPTHQPPFIFIVYFSCKTLQQYHGMCKFPPRIRRYTFPLPQLILIFFGKIQIYSCLFTSQKQAYQNTVGLCSVHSRQRKKSRGGKNVPDRTVIFL